MEDVTIISYPSTEQYQLLSLAEGRSRYMLPFCGKFRVVDFILGNARQSGARRTIIYSDVEDDLTGYVNRWILGRAVHLQPDNGQQYQLLHYL